MVAFYGTFFYLINVKDYSAVAQWTSQDVVQLYVPEKDRGRLEALDPNGKALKSFEFRHRRDAGSCILLGLRNP
jgi:hypothetical protein